MWTDYLIYGLLPYPAAAVFLIGLVFRIRGWAGTPVPLKVPMTPGPETRIGAGLRLAGRFFLFSGLFRRDPLLWAAAWFFHLSLVLVLLRHLRYFLYPVPGWVLFFQESGLIAGYVMAASLLVLLFRRLVKRPLVHLSRTSDFLVLALLLGACGTGLALRLFYRVDLVEVKAMTLGWVRFAPHVPREPGLLWLHLAPVFLLGLYFPFSRLTHGLGLPFSPILNQADDALMERHVNPWDEEETRTPEGAS